jgi:hypothetical protein
LLLPKVLQFTQIDAIDELETTLMFDDDDDDNDDSPFLTIDETAKLLRVNRRTLDNLRWSGDGPASRPSTLSLSASSDAWATALTPTA